MHQITVIACFHYEAQIIMLIRQINPPGNLLTPEG